MNKSILCGLLAALSFTAVSAQAQSYYCVAKSQTGIQATGPVYQVQDDAAETACARCESASSATCKISVCYEAIPGGSWRPLLGSFRDCR